MILPLRQAQTRDHGGMLPEGTYSSTLMNIPDDGMVIVTTTGNRLTILQVDDAGDTRLVTLQPMQLRLLAHGPHYERRIQVASTRYQHLILE